MKNKAGNNKVTTGIKIPPTMLKKIKMLLDVAARPADNKQRMKPVRIHLKFVISFPLNNVASTEFLAAQIIKGEETKRIKITQTVATIVNGFFAGYNSRADDADNKSNLSRYVQIPNVAYKKKQAVIIIPLNIIPLLTVQFLKCSSVGNKFMMQLYDIVLIPRAGMKIKMSQWNNVSSLLGSNPYSLTSLINQYKLCEIKININKKPTEEAISSLAMDFGIVIGKASNNVVAKFQNLSLFNTLIFKPRVLLTNTPSQLEYIITEPIWTRKMNKSSTQINFGLKR